MAFSLTGLFRRDDQLLQDILQEVCLLNYRIKKMASDLNTAISDLQNTVSAQDTALKSAEALLSNLNTLYGNEIQAAEAAGATETQLASLKALNDHLSSNTAELAASVAANTPAAPASTDSAPASTDSAPASTDSAPASTDSAPATGGAATVPGAAQ